MQPAPPTGPGLPYATPQSFDAAIKDLIASAAQDSAHSITELRRQFAYDRLLTRVFTLQPQHWVLKGGACLLARIPGHARHSQDIDLYFQREVDRAGADLTEAADADLGDFFTFDVEQARDLVGPNAGARFRITDYLGPKVFVGFGADVVVATNMTGTPDVLPGLCSIQVDGLPTAAYRTYPVVVHIADKHAAMLDTYGGRASSRYRDLVDLVLLATTQRPTAAGLHFALLSEYRHRAIAVPSEVTLPSTAWLAGYEIEAARVPAPFHTSVDEALAIVKDLIEPILAGRVSGAWDPEALGWVDG